MKALACIFALSGLVLLSARATLAQSPPARSTGNDALACQADDLLAAACQDGADLDDLAGRAAQLFDRIIQQVPPDQAPPYLHAAQARRLIDLVRRTSPARRADLVALLQRQKELAGLLAFTLTADDRPDQVSGLLVQLAARRAEALARLPRLAVALAVVFDEPLQRQIVENTAYAPHPLAVFDYFADHQRQLIFPLDSTAPQLLVWMVDTAADIDQMTWALARYAGQSKVGRFYFAVKYDKAHFYRGIPKRITQFGFTLPHILQYGGVCADQAYFAMSVGKALGIPTALAKGEHAQVFHAWVGYLEKTGPVIRWNFNEGRYASYRYLRGQVLDPQTRRTIPDSYVALTAALAGLSDEQRHQAVALTDALVRLVPAEDLPAAQSIQARQLARRFWPGLFEAILAINPGQRRAWLTVGRLAGQGVLTDEQKKAIAQRLTATLGKGYPEFTLAVLKPLIRSVAQPDRQDRLWLNAFAAFARRKELAAEILMERAALWDAQGHTVRAGQLYLDVVNRYANDGPFVLQALDKTVEQLEQAGLSRRIALLYAQTLDRLQPPGDYHPQFRKLTNWYRVAQRYLDYLKKTGRTAEAAKLQQRIDAALAP